MLNKEIVGVYMDGLKACVDIKAYMCLHGHELSENKVRRWVES